MANVSILIPSRGERFLVPTVKDLLAKAAGEIEIIAVLDGGAWPDPPLPDDPRVHVLRWNESRGMRPAINAAVDMSTGRYLLKCDGHTMWDEGFDEKLKAAYHEDNWITVPRRYALDPEAWAIDRSNNKYPIDYHYLSEPFHKYGDSVPGLHGTAWTARRDARKHLVIDDELASQGSAWFMARAHWNRIGPLDASKFGIFWYENQELALRTWLMGGAQKIVKSTWYAHLYKGKRYGRGYATTNMGHEAATRYTSWFYLTDQPFAGKVRTFRSLIEQFAPIPTWTDIDAIFARAQRELTNPYAAAAPAAAEDLMKLEVRSARYGVGEQPGEFVDVTETVKALVTKKGLAIAKISNDGLGVGNIFPGKRKTLTVDCRLDGAKKRFVALERHPLTVPPAA